MQAAPVTSAAWLICDESISVCLSYFLYSFCLINIKNHSSKIIKQI